MNFAAIPTTWSSACSGNGSVQAVLVSPNLTINYKSLYSELKNGFTKNKCIQLIEIKKNGEYGRPQKATWFSSLKPVTHTHVVVVVVVTRLLSKDGEVAETMEAQKPGNSLVSGPEVVETESRQRASGAKSP